MAYDTSYNPPGPQHFDFEYLWHVTTNITKHCPSDSRLIAFNQTYLNHDACLAISGTTNGIGLKTWTGYPAADVWTRLTSWKFPLVQLLFQFPRPPLGISVETFTLCHLLGDPIDTLSSLLFTLAFCQSRAKFWRDICEQRFFLGGNETDEDARFWRRLALIGVSYDEWGMVDEADWSKGRDVTYFLVEAFNRLNNRQEALLSPTEAVGPAAAVRNQPAAHITHLQLQELKRLCAETAQALAADRSTKFLPVFVAQILFIGSIAVAFIKTSTSPPGPSNWINVEAHSIAFTVPFLWVIPVVIFGSIIGVSQTELAIPSILRRFQHDALELVESSDALRGLLPCKLDLPDTELRVRSGGIYSWQPEQWYKPPQCRQYGQMVRTTPGMGEKILLALLSFFIVLSCTIAACLISGRVPPGGWGCRPYGQLSMFLTWLVSYGIGFTPTLAPQLRSHSLHLRLIYTKDVVTTVLIILIVFITQVGAFNRCSCLTKFGTTGLQLPQQPHVLKTLQYRITRDYLGLAFGCVGLQFAVFCIAWYCFLDAFAVYLQRDDNTPNLHLFYRFKAWCLKWRVKRNDTGQERRGSTDDRGELLPLHEITSSASHSSSPSRSRSPGEPLRPHEQQHGQSLHVPEQVGRGRHETSQRRPYPRQPSVDFRVQGFESIELEHREGVF